MRNRKLLIIILFIFFSAAIAIFASPISQSSAYHNFADKRTCLGIINSMDVISNLPFFLLGCWGLIFILRNRLKHTSKEEKILWGIFFVASALVGVFSTFYHLNPSNFRLFFDRLAISIITMAFFSLMIIECFGKKVGVRLSPYLFFLGIFSVVYWIITESYGVGDLRFYIYMQIVPVVLTLLFLLFFHLACQVNFTYIWQLVFLLFQKLPSTSIGSFSI